jgi:hypothetical protein
MGKYDTQFNTKAVAIDQMVRWEAVEEQLNSSHMATRSELTTR